MDLESQTSPIRETSPQVSGSRREPFLENQISSMPVLCPNDSKNQQLELKRNETEMTANDSGDDKISPPEIKKETSQIEEKFVRDQITNGLYMPLSSIIVLKRKKKWCMSLWISRMA